MATITPSHLNSRATAGERLLHRMLGQLPDNCHVYYEPMVDGRHPDFVVIVPQLGVLVIEVKGWKAAELRHLDSKTVIWKRGEQCTEERSPELQVREYLFRLMDEARNHRWSKRLLHTDGHRQGKFRFPFAPLIVMSNITGASLSDNGIDREDWDNLFPAERTILREQLGFLKSLEGDDLVGALRPFVHPFWSFPALSDQEVKALRAIVHPEIKLGDHVDIERLEGEPKAVNDQQDVLQVLDAEQEDYALAIGEGHRIIYGVAGSGKTVLLIARAKRLAETGSERVLVTCFNKMLAMWIEQELREYPNIKVRHFHAWAKGVGCVWQQGESDEALGERLLSQLQSEVCKDEKWDAILIDEAQDFEPVWFRCLLAVMEDPDNGDLLIAADGCQSLYRRNKISWIQLGIKARGRTVSTGYQLHRNYRNSREIIALAESFAHSVTDGNDLNAIQGDRVDISRCERTTGVSPLFIQCGNRRTELLQAYEITRGLLEGKWRGRPVGVHAPHEIAIFYPYADAVEKEQFANFTVWMCERGIPTTWLAKDRDARERIADQSVKLQTIHSAKGLQYRAVIIVGANKLPRSHKEREERLADRRLLYVAMTRAVSLLALTSVGRSEFVDEIASTPAVEVISSIYSAKAVLPLNSSAVSADGRH